MPDTITHLHELYEGGPWRYGGMIGDPGKPLRHFVKDAEGEPILFSDDFAADYAHLDAPLRKAAALHRLLSSQESEVTE